jgi:hypothetical protein
MPRFASLAALVLALVPIASCGSTPKVKVEEPDAAILGEWRSPSTGARLSFSAGGLYSLIVKDQPRPVMGSFEFDPKAHTLTLQTRRESPMCADDVGSYSVRLGDMTLDPEPVRDTCDARRKIFSAPFERVVAKRAGSSTAAVPGAAAK